jgi:hypothetical protein
MDTEKFSQVMLKFMETLTPECQVWVVNEWRKNPELITELIVRLLNK